jgi:hypothetical protein
MGMQALGPWRSNRQKDGCDRRHERYRSRARPHVRGEGRGGCGRIELDLAISYLSRFVIVRGVAERLGVNRTEQISKPRVFVMGGPGVGIEGDPSDLNADRTNDYWHAHMNTVAGNEALVIDGASRYLGVNFYGLNPGLVKSNIRSHFLGWFNLG